MEMRDKDDLESGENLGDSALLMAEPPCELTQRPLSAVEKDVTIHTRDSEMRRADVSVLGWEGTARSQGGDNDVVSRLGRLRGGRTELSVDDSLLGDLNLLNKFGEPLRDALDEGVWLEREYLEK